MNKKYIPIIIVVISIFIISQQLKIVQLKNNQSIEIQLQECPLCGYKVDIKPVNDSFYIECKKCGIHTRYFYSKDNLIKYWNTRTD